MYPGTHFRNCSGSRKRAMRKIKVSPLNHRTNRQRAQSLVDYTESTSWIRVFAVCSLAFVPSFAFVILIEFMPLKPPSEGWRTNWVLWIRLTLSAFVLSLGAATQLIILIPASGLKFKHTVLIAISATIGFELTVFELAQFWRFPVPFGLLVGSPAWQSSMICSLFACIGANKWRASPEILKQVKATIRIISVQTLLIFIYPVFNAVFLRLHGYDQIAFVLVLPVTKFGMNTLTVRVSTGTPAARAIGMVTVELFNSLYLLKCMQSAASTRSVAGLITVDLIQNLLQLWRLREHVKHVKEDLAKSGINFEHRDMIQKSMARVASRTDSLVRPQYTTPRVYSRSTIVPSVPSRLTGRPRTTKLLLAAKAMKVFNHQAGLVRLDNEVHDLLQECDRLVLIEFIQCSIPIFYALYLGIAFHLPNAKYYPELKRLDAAKLVHTIHSILTYAVLEFALLLYIHLFLRWQFNISALHLLASVLERENSILQGVFLAWVIIVLQLTLEHAGT